MQNPNILFKQKQKNLFYNHSKRNISPLIINTYLNRYTSIKFLLQKLIQFIDQID